MVCLNRTDLSILAVNIFNRIRTLHVSSRVLEADQIVLSQASLSNPVTVSNRERTFSKFKLFLVFYNILRTFERQVRVKRLA